MDVSQQLSLANSRRSTIGSYFFGFLRAFRPTSVDEKDSPFRIALSEELFVQNKTRAPSALLCKFEIVTTRSQFNRLEAKKKRNWIDFGLLFGLLCIDDWRHRQMLIDEYNKSIEKSFALLLPQTRVISILMLKDCKLAEYADEFTFCLLSFLFGSLEKVRRRSKGDDGRDCSFGGRRVHPNRPNGRQVNRANWRWLRNGRRQRHGNILFYKSSSSL